MTQLGFDSFVRSNQSGWGTATDGQTWTKTGSGTLSISSNEGVCVSSGADTHVQLGSQTSADMELLCRISINNVNDVAGLQGRFTASGGTTCYKLLWYGGNININKAISGASSNIKSAAFTMTVNTYYWFRFRVVAGNLFGKIWQDGVSSGEPSTWNVTATDSSVNGSAGFAVLGNTDPTSTGIHYDSFYVVDYLWSDSIPASDSFLGTDTTQFVDQVPASDSAFMTSAYSPVDNAPVSDSAAFTVIFLPINALSAQDSFSGIVVSVGVVRAAPPRDIFVKVMRAGVLVNGAGNVSLQLDNMSIQEAASFQGTSPYFRYWGYPLVNLDIQQGDLVVDLYNIDPKTGTNTQYRVINSPEPFPDFHMEIALDKMRGT